MARKTSNVSLPPDVRAIKAKGQTYYYYQRNRGTKQPGERTPLGKDPHHPDFWKKYRELTGEIPPEDQAGTVARMVAGWYASAEWQTYAEGTQRDYKFYSGKIDLAWGALQAKAVTPKHALALRDTLAESPGSANHMISIGKMLWRWGIPRGHAEINPFREIDALDAEDEGHRPWPDWAFEFVEQHAYPDLARFVYLALQVGQRESDVVRLGAGAMDGGGLWVRPLKTKKRRKPFWVPLLSEAKQRLREWTETPIVFNLQRRKAPLSVGPCQTFVFSPTGSAYTTEGLRSRWNRWLATDGAKPFLERWHVEERAQRERDGEDISPDKRFKPTLHGLRSTAVIMRRMAGYADEQISNDIGMSLPMVRRYSRFIDQRRAAENNIVLLEERKKRLASP